MIPRHHHNEIPGSVIPFVERMHIHNADLHAHSVLVSGLSLRFAAHLGFTIRDQRLIERAAVLHDVGKLHIPAWLLQKPTALDEQEWATMRTHPALGSAILEQEGVGDSLLVDVVQNHHERLDGTGYPAGLSGKQVSEVVRVITLCDVFAAMTETRRYARPYTWQAALERMAGKRTRLDLPFLRHFAAMIAAQHAHSSDQHQSRIAGRLQCRGEICRRQC